MNLPGLQWKNTTDWEVLKNGILFILFIFGGQKSKSKGAAGLLSSGASFSGSQVAAFLRCLRVAFSLCESIPVSLLVLVSSSAFTISFNLHYLLKGPISR